MAAERETPTELGIPLPLVPVDDLENEIRLTNWHHHFHPRTDPALAEDGGIAIRTSRYQRAIARGSHEQYHQHFTGPELPQTTEERFRVLIMALAGFLPDHGILTRGRQGPEIVELSPAQKGVLRSEGHLRSGNPCHARDFLARFVVAQDLSDIKFGFIDELLNTDSARRRMELGTNIFAIATNRAVIPIDQEYRKARESGQILPAIPPKPAAFVKLVLGGAEDRVGFAFQLANRLAA